MNLGFPSPQAFNSGMQTPMPTNFMFPQFFMPGQMNMFPQDTSKMSKDKDFL
jgi:hypothetical protein